METASIETNWTTGYEYADIAAVLKTAWMIDDGPSELAFILDWDGVVTTTHDGVSGTSWGVLKRHMTPENRRLHREYFDTYGPLLALDELSWEASEEWQREALKLLIGSRLAAIEDDARNTAHLQPGVKDLFKLCNQANVPIFIKSSGASQAIEAIAQKHNLTPTKIFSNEFDVENGKITGIKEHSFTHTLNKHHHSHLAVDGHEMRRRTIVIGDNLQDAHMIDPDTNDLTLRIRVGQSRAAHIQQYGLEAWQNFIAKSFDKGYDAVAIDNGLLAVVGLTREIAERRYQLLTAA